MSDHRGSRKLKHAREMAILLTLGFVFAVLCKAPEGLFVTFSVGIGALSGAFVAGNMKEHQALKQ